MVASRADRAHEYRERADELRTVAHARSLPESRDLLNRLADDYERLAAELEIHEAERQARVSRPT